MIRVNLLHSRKDGMQRLPAEGGASAFISGREVLLAAVFLVLGGIILWVVVSNSNGPDDAALVAEETTAPPALAPPEQAFVPDGQADPARVAEAAIPQGETPAPLASGSGEPPAVAAAVAESAASSATGNVQRPVSSPSTQTPPPARPPSQPAAPAPRSSAASPPATSSGTSAAPSGSLILSAVRVFTRGSDLQIIAATDGLPEYKLFRVENPDRVVIDIPGAWLEVPRAERERTVSHPVVQQLRIAQNQLEPPLVRVVLEVSSFPELQVVPRSDGLVISVPGG